MEDREELKSRLETLREEHLDLGEAIENLSAPSRFDPLRLRRLKKRKLALKDQIIHLESLLLPDIIA